MSKFTLSSESLFIPFALSSDWLFRSEKMFLKYGIATFFLKSSLSTFVSSSSSILNRFYSSLFVLVLEVFSILKIVLIFF